MAKKKITLKTANGQDSLYPRTAASQVEVTANTTLDTYMKGMVDSISDGTTVVVKKANEAVSLTNAPSLAASGTKGVTVTAGGKTSEAFTIPFATTATNLESAPTITNSGANGIEITVGGKGTGSYTIPYATKALQDKDGKDIDKTYAKIQALDDGDVVPFKAKSLEYGDGNITAQELIDTAKQEINAATKEELNTLEGKVTTNTSEIKKIKEGPTFVYGAERDGEGMDIVSRYAKQADFNQYKTTTDDKISKIQASTTSAYVSQGSVQNLTELHSVSNVAKGYVYNILTAGVLNENTENERHFPAGANVVYIGENGADADPNNDDNWDLLGGIVDLSGYATKDDVSKKQDIITDLATIRSGAAKGETALQSYTEKYTGTITAVKANGTSIATSGEANIPAASTSVYGVTKLSSATNSTSEVLAATPKAVKSAYDLANGKYTKPSTGIPKTDLASTVQTSLGKADTALQSHQDISGKLDKTTAESTYLKKTDAVSTYAKQADVGNYIGAIGDDNKPMGLTYTVDGTVTY